MNERYVMGLLLDFETEKNKLRTIDPKGFRVTLTKCGSKFAIKTAGYDADATVFLHFEIQGDGVLVTNASRGKGSFGPKVGETLSLQELREVLAAHLEHGFELDE